MPLLNTEYFSNLTDSIGSCSSCEQLQDLTDEAFQSIGDLKNSIADEMEKLAPIFALLTAPGANLGQIVTWITGFITNVLTPMYKPYLTYTAQLVELTTAVAELAAAIQSASHRFPSCDITIPTI